MVMVFRLKSREYEMADRRCHMCQKPRACTTLTMVEFSRGRCGGCAAILRLVAEHVDHQDASELHITLEAVRCKFSL
jgi:hypothetical protein